METLTNTDKSNFFFNYRNTANYQLKIPAGIYNVQVVTEKGVMNKKLVVK